MQVPRIAPFNFCRLLDYCFIDMKYYTFTHQNKENFVESIEKAVAIIAD